ncbi:MAG: ribbon-helix-helix protein, CopG family [Acidimicrobiia bacterium]|nr:ribbon-helix-helix protein, CopG family [Acidimicrobiia bacterium]
MSLKRDLSGFADPGGLPAPPPPPAVSPAVVAPAPDRAVPEAPPGGDAQASGAPGSGEGPAPPAAPPGRGSRGARSGGGRSGRKGGSGRPGRKRICVSLTLEASEQLAGLAQARRSWKVEVILEALDRWDSPLREGQGNGERARFRRRRSSTPTPFVMDLTPGELGQLDELAAAVGTSRSALVRQLILLEATAAATATATNESTPSPGGPEAGEAGDGNGAAVEDGDETGTR